MPTMPREFLIAQAAKFYGLDLQTGVDGEKETLEFVGALKEQNRSFTEDSANAYVATRLRMANARILGELIKGGYVEARYVGPVNKDGTFASPLDPDLYNFRFARAFVKAFRKAKKKGKGDRAADARKGPDARA